MKIKDFKEVIMIIRFITGLLFGIIGLLVIAFGPIVIALVYGSPIWLFLYFVSWIPGIILIIIGRCFIE